MDWAYFSYQDAEDRWYTVYAFVYVFSFSRYMYVELTERMDPDTLFRCLLRALKACSVPQEIMK